MPVKIRLRRMGRKKQPHFRVVVSDSRSPRDGRFVETLGYYKPLSDPARLVLDLERVDYWLEEGASPSDTVRSLITKARKGGADDLAVGEIAPEERQAKRAEALASKRAAETRGAAKPAETHPVPEEPAAGDAEKAE
ncbi:MAG: 30S ribosomal protein S16 [Gemmatimonadales bacterium]